MSVTGDYYLVLQKVQKDGTPDGDIATFGRFPSENVALDAMTSREVLIWTGLGNPFTYWLVPC